jgi:SpoVK/Ycf46/Vps4 family AAA+-type ATPase
MKSLFENERIYFVYSDTDSLNDEYIYSLDVISFEEALFRHLRKLGFKRILFYNGALGLYAYDEDSFKRKKSKKLRIEGILKREKKETLKLQRNMVESEMLENLEHFMKNEKKGSFIITDFFSLLNNLEAEELKQLNQLILDFKQLEVENENILIFLEPSNLSLNKIKEKLNGYRNLENLIHDIIESEGNIIRIEKAYDDEVNNLLNYLRIKNGLETNFLEIDNLSKEITRYIRQNREVVLRDVHKKLINIKKIDFKEINKKLLLKEGKTGWDKFDELVGVDEVKEKIREIVEWVKKQKKEKIKFDGDIKRLNKINEKSFKAHLNIVLKGNPGTGKTTIAKIIGEIFKEEGILPYGQFINASRSDLVAGYVGQTAIKTAEIIQRAKGGVLFIDEAYSIIQNNSDHNDADFGKEAVDEMVKKLSDLEGEISVILAGYEDDMNTFLETNEGLKRRFPNEIYLRDYLPNELKEIFLRLVKKENIKLDKEFEEVLDYLFKRAYESGFTKKYNAGFSVNLFNALMQKSTEIFKIEYIPEEYRVFLPTKYQNIDISPEIFEELNSFIGLKNVKEEIKKIIAQIIGAKRRGEVFKVPHYAFVGNPGTGKTTVAKLLGKIFKEMNLLKGKFLQVSEQDLIGSVVGETSKRVSKKVEEAKGGVLFIDEAYSLMNSQAGKQAIDTLIQEMENKRGEFCLILAGYPAEIDALLKANPGFSSRVDKTIVFEDYNEDELYEIFLKYVKDNDFNITPKAKEKLKDVIKEMVKNKDKHFGNAREVRKLFERTKANVDSRLLEESTNREVKDFEYKLITDKDIKL